MKQRYFAAGCMFALLCVYLYITRPQPSDDGNRKRAGRILKLDNYLESTG